ncbi:MAG: glycosidase [Victivallales bacterium]
MLAIKRYPGNPILGPNPDLPWGQHEARNPGVVFDGRKFHLVFTATPEPRNGEIYLGYASGSDGIHFECAPEPLLRPSPDPDDFDHASVEDARITELDGKFYIAYAARSFNMLKFAAGERRVGPDGNRNPTWTENFRRVGFAVTTDWQHCRKLGPITSEHICDANVALFPEKINGKYLILHRPTTAVPWTLPCFYSPASIWLVFSDSLERWSSNRREMPWNMIDGEDIPDEHLLIKPEYEWESMKIGASGIPIPTDDGWLMFYHAVDRKGVYRVGLMLLDRQNPLKVLARSPLPVMQPEGTFEQSGAYPNCVFPCANIVVGDEIFIYYGAADLYCCLATVKLQETLNYINQYRTNGKKS